MALGDKIITLDNLDAFKGEADSTYAASTGSTGTAAKAAGLLYGAVDSTSTSTVFTATVPGLTELTDGAMVLLKNGVVTSAANFTVNVNNLGAKPVYSNMAAATRETTIFNINYTLLFVYDSTRVDGGCWVNYRGYYSDANSIGHQLRTNSSTLPTTAKFYRYRILFTSADGTHLVPANTSTSTNATAKRDVIQTPINPFGPIVYYGTTAVVEAEANPSAANLWQQYPFSLGYSFNRTGAALVLPFPAPIYLKCAPQTNGSAIIDATTPYVHALPSTKDGKIYIFLGFTYSATNIEMRMEHPVFWHDGTGIRVWTGAEPSSGSSVTPSSTMPAMDGVASVGTSTDYARADHVHPTDTSRQATLVSGTNIKTINGNSLLGSGDLSVGGSVTMTDAEVDAAVDAAWPPPVQYTITNNVGNLISVNKQTAQEGETVTVTLEGMMEKGDVINVYAGQSFVCELFESGATIYIETFTMPASNVTIVLEVE